MKPLLIPFLLLGITPFSNAQINKSGLSLLVHADYHKYSFSSNYYTDQQVTGNGISPGFVLMYDRQVRKGLEINLCAGYYKYNFDIRRPFKYSLDPLSALLYNTENYYYNCITASLGVNHSKQLTKNFISTAGLNYTYYYTLGQKYKPFRNYTPQKENASYHFANTIHLTYSLQKRMGNYDLGFQIRLPIWENWRKDPVFKESKNEYYSKFFNGVGLGLICSHNL